MAKNVLIIGAGGVAQVVAHKVAQNAQEFGTLHIASRTVAKADKIIASIREKGHQVEFSTHPLDAMDSKAVAALIRRIDAHIVINVGSSFVNMTVLDGCIEAGAAYLDTAIHEDPAKVCETPPWYGNYEWKRREAVEKAGITAILGAGFDHHDPVTGGYHGQIQFGDFSFLGGGVEDEFALDQPDGNSGNGRGEGNRGSI